MRQLNLKCGNCQSNHVVLNGRNSSGSQTYRCKNCGCCRVLNSVKKKKDIDIEALLKVYQENNSLRLTGKLFGVSHVTVFNKLKK